MNHTITVTVTATNAKQKEQVQDLLAQNPWTWVQNGNTFTGRNIFPDHGWNALRHSLLDIGVKITTQLNHSSRR